MAKPEGRPGMADRPTQKGADDGLSSTDWTQEPLSAQSLRQALEEDAAQPGFRNVAVAGRPAPTVAAARSQAAGRSRRVSLEPYLFLLPYLGVFLLLRLGPTLAGFGISFLKWNIIGTPVFAGASNYTGLLRDPVFFLSFKNTLYFVVLTAPALVVLGLLLALLVNARLRGRMVARTVIFTPYVVMAAVVGVIWLWIFNKDVGILNFYLGFLGLGKLPWLSSTNLAMPAVAIATLWWSVGFNMIIFLAGLQDIPQELEEAAHVDGANSLAAFRHVTLPLLAPTTFVVVMLTLINTIQVFDQIYVMTGGGPTQATLTLIQYLYYQAFQFFKLGYGSAVAYIVLVVLVILALLQRRLIPET